MIQISTVHKHSLIYLQSQATFCDERTCGHSSLQICESIFTNDSRALSKHPTGVLLLTCAMNFLVPQKNRIKQYSYVLQIH